VFPGFLIQLVDDAAAPFRTRLRITHEAGAGREQPLHWPVRETFVLKAIDGDGAPEP